MIPLLRPPLSRRTLLRGAGGVAIALPFLEAMLGRRASAQVAPPKRFVAAFTGNGTIKASWAFHSGSTGFTLGQILQPLQPHAARLNLVDGLNLYGVGPDGRLLCCNGHDGLMTLWSGRRRDEPRAATIDQVMAQALGGSTRYRSLEFGVCATADKLAIPLYSRMVWSNGTTPVAPMEEPRATFDRLFGGGVPSPPPQSSPDAGTSPAFDVAAAQRLAMRKSVLDTVTADLERLVPRLGTADRQKLDMHLSTVRDVERAIEVPAPPPPPGSTPPPPPPPPSGSCGTLARPAAYSTVDYAHFPEMARLQLDLLALALACDLTRVASFQFSTAHSELVHTWLGHNRGHHDISHLGNVDATAEQQLTSINAWYATQFGYLLDRLASYSEGGRTVLDNSVVVWGNELRSGSGHSADDMPFVLAGSCGGFFRTGQYRSYPGTRHTGLLVSLLAAMGLPRNGFGDPQYTGSGLAGLAA